MRKNDGNIILNSLDEAEESVKNLIPEGYIEVRLSTKGKLGAPKSFHIRNFKVRDIVALSLTSEADLPVRLISVLNDMIYEDVDVGTWHEKEVEETMIYVFMTFYKPVLEDVVFSLTAEDIEMYKEQQGEETYKAIKEKKFIPRTTVNIATDVDTYEVPNDFNPEITITNKKTGFHVTFSYVKYGDQLAIKRWMDSYFKEDEAKFKNLKERLKYNNNISNQLKDDPVKVDQMMEIDPEEEEAYKEYTTRRLQTISEVVKLVSVVDFNGQDLRDMSIGEKYDLLSNDARLDYGMIAKLNKRQEKIKYGVKPEVNMRHPLTGEVVKRPYPFRFFTLLQAMQLSGYDDYDDGYGDED